MSRSRWFEFRVKWKWFFSWIESIFSLLLTALFAYRIQFNPAILVDDIFVFCVSSETIRGSHWIEENHFKMPSELIYFNSQRPSNGQKNRFYDSTVKNTQKSAKDLFIVWGFFTLGEGEKVLRMFTIYLILTRTHLSQPQSQHEVVPLIHRLVSFFIFGYFGKLLKIFCIHNRNDKCLLFQFHISRFILFSSVSTTNSTDEFKEQNLSPKIKLLRSGKCA